MSARLYRRTRKAVRRRAAAAAELAICLPLLVMMPAPMSVAPFHFLVDRFAMADVTTAWFSLNGQLVVAAQGD